MNGKGRKAKNQAHINNSMNVLSQEELGRRIAAIETDMKSSTWKDLEVDGKFDKNAKLTFISDDMLILGCDVGSETHYVRAIDTRGRELSKDAFPFNNNAEGFQSAKAWAMQIAAEHGKSWPGADRALLVLPGSVDDHKRCQCRAGQPVRSEADKGTGGQQSAEGRPEGSEADREPGERRELRHALSAGRCIRGTATAVDAAGPADRGPDPERKQAAQRDEDLFSRIHGRIRKAGWSIHPDGSAEGSVSRGHPCIRRGGVEGDLA